MKPKQTKPNQNKTKNPKHGIEDTNKIYSYTENII